MPKSWSNKDERQYKHMRKKGSSKKKAAATVNKKRRAQGRTKKSY